MYLIRKVAKAPSLDAAWDSADWNAAETLDISNVRPESSSHHPKVQLRLLYTDKGIYGRYLVHDQYVRSTAKNFQDSVCIDSCVEAFIEPAAGKGYINFEMNCGGTLLAYHVTDPARTPKGLAAYHALTLDEVAGLEIKSTLAKINDPEIAEPTVWSLAFFFPFSIFKTTNGQSVPKAGEVWRANFYKCADKTSHPHWLSWQPVKVLNFHLPECFGEIRFE